MKKNTSLQFATVMGLTLLGACFSTQSFAKNENSGEAAWYLFLGADLGGSNYSAYNNSQTEAARSGSHLGGRLLLSHYSENWVFDGGAGIQFINNKGTNSDNSVNTDKTTNGFLTFSPRYRLGENFQLGPEFQYWVTTDKGLNATVTGSDLIDDSLTNTSAWLGAQLLYEWGNKVRLGGRWMTDLNVPMRSVTVYQAFIQIGFDIFGSSSSVEESKPRKHYEQVTEDDLDRAEEKVKEEPLPMATPEPTPVTPEPEPVVMSTPEPPVPEATPEMTPEPTPEPAPIVEEAPKPAPKMTVTLDVNDLPFGFDNATLPKSNAARVKNIGAFLKKHNSSWKKLLVSGHTDERGTKEYNQRLSQKRAQAVKTLLVSGGAPASKIRAVGLGETEPLDRRHNEKAWSKNRRVELEFFGVKDTMMIKKAMKQ